MMPNFRQNSPVSIAIEQILVGSQIWKREVNEWLELHNLHIDYVMIQSELRHLIGAKVVRLKCWVFGGKTGPITMVQVFCLVRPVAMVRFRVEPQPEPTREFGPVANTTLKYGWAFK